MLKGLFPNLTFHITDLIWYGKNALQARAVVQGAMNSKLVIYFSALLWSPSDDNLETEALYLWYFIRYWFPLSEEKRAWKIRLTKAPQRWSWCDKIQLNRLSVLVLTSASWLCINPLGLELNPSTQCCLTRFLLGILLLEPCFSLIYAWKTNKYTNYSFSVLIMYGSSYMFWHYIAILGERS
jgi:hypothetical protein